MPVGIKKLWNECMTEAQSELPVRHPIWPVAVVTFGISLSAAWVMLIGYGPIRLIEQVI